MKKSYLWGIIVVLAAVIAGQQAILGVQRSTLILLISESPSLAETNPDALLVHALGMKPRSRSYIFEFVRNFDSEVYPTVRPPSEALQAHTKAMGWDENATLGWIAEARTLQENADTCSAVETLIKGMQTDRTYLAFLIDDIDTVAFPLIEALLESDCADRVIPFISALAVASADPVAYLRNLLLRMSEEQIATIWHADPFVYISNFNEKEALRNVNRAIDFQDRNPLNFALQGADSELESGALHIEAGEPEREGALLVGWQESFLNLSPGEAGIRFVSNSEIIEPLEMVVDVSGLLSNGHHFEQLLRVPIPTPQDSGALIFDTDYIGDSLFVSALSQFGRLQPWFVQGLSTDNFLDTILNIRFIGLDIPPTTENRYYIDSIELYLPQDSWHRPPTPPNVMEFQLNLHAAPEQKDGIDQEHFARLQAIGYLDAVSLAPKESGVVTYDPEQAYPGYNFFQSGDNNVINLMDMEGDIVHTWQPKFGDKRYEGRIWRRSHLYPNGDVLALLCDEVLVKMDKDSKIHWKKIEQGFHHDMFIQDDGQIFILSREWEENPLAGMDAMTLVDYVEILDSNGESLKKISTLKALEDSSFAPLLRNAHYSGDILHTNSIQVLDGQLSDRIPAFREGNVLLCLLQIDFIGVLDMEEEVFTWGLAGQWNYPHDPKLLPNDRMLLFDNVGPMWHRLMYPASRVVEFDPLTREVTWEYRGTPEQPFFSRTCGAAWDLPNGNFLITETNSGRVLEVTRDKDIVWEYINPVRTGENDALIPVINEMIRYSEEFVADWLS